MHQQTGLQLLRRHQLSEFQKGFWIQDSMNPYTFSDKLSLFSSAWVAVSGIAVCLVE
ncbi:hypothetical protein DAPPUDRAFT_246975 [Daphnia pulex]|uniref:Uncharacterized protein n=1 Tax=Daphnia pulex TaxID=6669 RepID=E9GRI7_DAPPU|nr:hypothetical protein DAPPUDRAFT_246975 [Daphnia pulex]|eukprot:EFX77779.1 hypothetical protein DAPPUDRAFT_246975 [Daphnia pulex]